MKKSTENWGCGYRLRVIHKNIDCTTASAHHRAVSSLQPLPTAQGPRLEIRLLSAAAGRLPPARISAEGCPFFQDQPHWRGGKGWLQREDPHTQLGDLVLLTPHPAEAAWQGEAARKPGQGQPRPGWGRAGAAGAEWPCQAPPASTRGGCDTAALCCITARALWAIHLAKKSTSPHK